MPTYEDMLALILLSFYRMNIESELRKPCGPTAKTKNANIETNVTSLLLQPAERKSAIRRLRVLREFSNTLFNPLTSRRL